MSSPRAVATVAWLVATGLFLLGLGPVAGIIGRPKAAAIAVVCGVVVGLLAEWREAAHQLRRPPEVWPHDCGPSAHR
jgi:hypothetical protein